MLIKKGKTGKGGDGTGAGAATVVAPPDGGWGWMVVFGSFMIHLITNGMAYSLGVYQENFLSEFGAWYSEVKFLGPLMLAVTLGSGPIASMLTNKYGCRLVAILGTVIAAFGFSISIFAPNFYFLYFSFGIVAGVYILLTPIVIIDLFGLDKLSNAFGIVLLFQGIGTFLGPPIAGAVFDVTQDYNILFYLMGACITLSGAMLYFILCIQRHQQRTSYGKDGGHLATDGALKKSTPAAVVLPSTEEQMLMAA